MSAFLGPIHYWLYEKIGNQEKLTATLSALAEKRGWVQDAPIELKELPPLEDVIDEGNIHAWLQARIADGEERYANFIVNVLEEDPSRLEELKLQAFDFGRENAPKGAPDLEGIYKYFEDFFVNGMPCDRINQLTEQGETKLAWMMTRDIHGIYWPQEDGTNYYILRKAVMDGMLEGTGFQALMKDPFHYELVAK